MRASEIDEMFIEVRDILGGMRNAMAAISLRDFFAAQVLASANAARASFGKGGEAELAEHCYKLADAMLVAREKKAEVTS